MEQNDWLIEDALARWEHENPEQLNAILFGDGRGFKDDLDRIWFPTASKYILRRSHGED